MFTCTLDQARNAIARYNRTAVIRLDSEAAKLFRAGLPREVEAIGRRVEFVLNRYNGLHYKASPGLIQAIARRIAKRHDLWQELLQDAPTLKIATVSEAMVFRVPPQEIFDCFAPLRRPGDAPIRPMAKMLHLLKPDSFIIQDRWIGRALDIPLDQDSGPREYAEFSRNFLAFLLRHREIFIRLKESDAAHSWSDVKLVDKVLLCRRACDARLAA